MTQGGNRWRRGCQLPMLKKLLASCITRHLKISPLQSVAPVITPTADCPPLNHSYPHPDPCGFLFFTGVPKIHSNQISPQEPGGRKEAGTRTHQYSFSQGNPPPRWAQSERFLLLRPHLPFLICLKKSSFYFSFLQSSFFTLSTSLCSFPTLPPPRKHTSKATSE